LYRLWFCVKWIVPSFGSFAKLLLKATASLTLSTRPYGTAKLPQDVFF